MDTVCCIRHDAVHMSNEHRKLLSQSSVVVDFVVDVVGILLQDSI